MKRGVFVAAVAAAVVTPAMPVPAAPVEALEQTSQLWFGGTTGELAVVEYWWKTYHCTINPETGEITNERVEHHAYDTGNGLIEVPV